MLFHEEALHGYVAPDATSFPQAIAMASAWDPAITQRITHEKSPSWPKGRVWHIQTFVNGQLRRESFTAGRKSEIRDLAAQERREVEATP